jgi:hypothetical protein
MKPLISPQSIVLRLVSHASMAGLRLAEFRDVFIHMLDSTAQDIHTGQLLCNIVKLDVLRAQVGKLHRMVS